MDECGSCGRTLASRWNFCIYCGQQLATPVATATTGTATATADRTPSGSEYVFDDSEYDELPHRERKHDTPFWVGVAMGVAGLGIIIFAATEMISAHG